MSMLQKLLFLASGWLFGLPAWATGTPPIELKPGMVITSSVQVKKGTYQLNGPDSLSQQVILIKGDNIIVDFNKAILQGSTNKAFPNEFHGLAILLKGNNITIKNAIVKGYKVAIMAVGCWNLKIEYCDLSYNYRQHLQSSWLHEDLSDWMSYHHNENDEWLRYGAGIYLKDCNNSTINNNTITGGQCGLMMMRCDDGTINNNDFSFNSAIGIGMYRSSRNKVMSNKLDFNVRGYSHGFFNRGQDSAGMLVFEQCNDNIFAFNSVTHGGDGFFLWAGQTTMDKGVGGCNNNYIYKNDFSYAPTNGVEVTFSKNTIEGNTIKECDHGIWGGYSWQTSITGNRFYKNRIGIAIEHGQNNNISYNSFDLNKQAAIKLWARKIEPSDWGYPNKKDTRSMGYNLWENSFSNEKIAVDVTMTKDIILYRNVYTNTSTELKKDSSVTGIEINPASVSDTTTVPVEFLNKWKDKTIPTLKAPAGREHIRITEWGSYNYRYPIIFLKKIDSNNIYYFDILGPGGKWQVRSTAGTDSFSMSGKGFPATFSAQRNAPDLKIELEYTGPAFTDQFGKFHSAIKSYRFSFRDMVPDIKWDVSWYKWDAAHDPNKDYRQFQSVFKNTPVKTEQASKVDYTWWGAIGKNLPADSFATVATGTFEVPKGKYTLAITADDLVKVFIDGKPVIDFWDATKYKNDEDAYHAAKVELNGKHRIRIEHVENGGYATLIFYLKPEQ